MKTLQEALPEGTHKQLGVVVQETWLSRLEILNTDGVTYHAMSDQVRFDSKPVSHAPKGFKKYGE